MAFKHGQKGYVRYGVLPAGGKSYNAQLGEYEPGVSVFNATYDSGARKWVLDVPAGGQITRVRSGVEFPADPRGTARYLHSLGGKKNTEPHLVAGDPHVEVGAEGEPILMNAKVVSKLRSGQVHLPWVQKSEEQVTFDEKVQRLAKSYAEIAQHLDPQAREHFESIPAERRDWFKRQMMEDTLTGAMNQYAYKTLGVEQRPGAHVRLDLNDLKALNDQFGHEQGNAAITGFGQHALAAARAHKGQLFRTGGDEFHAHFDTPEQAYSFLRATSQGVGGMVPTGGHHRVSFSAGVGQSPEHADRALYHAKSAKLARFADFRHDPQAVVGHGQHFIHSLLPGAAGQVQVEQSPAIPAGLHRPEPRVPMPMPKV